jgi:hypothetical protein
MTIKRRQLLQIAGLTWTVTPLGTLLADTATEPHLQLVMVKDNQALPEFAVGDMLLADTRETRYSGEGIYLYPHWGEPRPYHISLAAGSGHSRMLEFRNPGNQQLLWTQSPELDNQFAGKLKNHFSKHQLDSKIVKYSALILPVLPISPAGFNFGFNMPGRV